MFSSNKEFYDYVEDQIVWLKENGNIDASNDLDLSLHKGFTSGEIFNDLLGTFKRLKEQGVFAGTDRESSVNEIIADLTKFVNS